MAHIQSESLSGSAKKNLNSANRKQTEALNALEVSTEKMKQQKNSVLELHPVLNPYVHYTRQSQETELRKLAGDYKSAATQEDADRIKAVYDKKYSEYQNFANVSNGAYNTAVNKLQGISGEMEKTYQEAERENNRYYQLLNSYSGSTSGLDSKVLERSEERRVGKEC